MDFIIEEIETLIHILKIRKKNYTQRWKDSPPGGLIRIMRRGYPVYMHSVPDGTRASGQPRYKKTVLTENSDLLRHLVLKEYLRIAMKALDHNIRHLEHAKAGLLPLGFKAIRARMRKPYQAVSDAILSKGFLEPGFLLADFPSGVTCLPQHEWAAQPYRQSDYRPSEKIHFTSRGLAMRTRAELLIAEMLYQYEIPFRYEQVLPIGKYDFAPDFTFLDWEGNEFYWEYCGMMGDLKYRDRQLWRRSMYESIGITEWTNMIYTYDAADSIDMREIEAIIKTKILPRIQGR